MDGIDTELVFSGSAAFFKVESCHYCVQELYVMTATAFMLLSGAAGNLVKAMALFREIVDTVPTCPLPYLHAALLLASLGDVPSALRHLDAACKLCEDGTESESFDAVSRFVARGKGWFFNSI